MPNHVTNIITITGASIQDIMNITDTTSKSDQGSPFDFNVIKEIPVELINTVKGSYGSHDPRQEALLEQQRQNEERYGYATWYEFAIANWGTKWNAYDIYVDAESITFQTAWSTPEPIIKSLSTMIPDATIQVKYADEDWGSNCGIYEYKNGELMYEEDLSQNMVGKEDSLKFVSTVIYGDEDEIFNRIEENG